jgi:multidrug efflux pump
MVLGVMPLVFASGAGAASRYAIGLVISTGLAIGTLFTLFVVPGVYVLIGATHSREDLGESLSGSAEIAR